MRIPFAFTSRAQYATERNANHARGSAAQCTIPRCRMHAAAHSCYVGEAPLWDIESRVQGAGGVQSELVLLRVYVEL